MTEMFTKVVAVNPGDLFLYIFCFKPILAQNCLVQIVHICRQVAR